MDAGRELDSLVAEKVMGYRVREGIQPVIFECCAAQPPRDDADWCSVPRYSTDIAAAWQVIGRMAGQGFDHYVEGWRGKYWVKFSNEDRGMEGNSEDREVKARTAPEAICLAALKVMGIESDCT
jgi:hypothetical protein